MNRNGYWKNAGQISTGVSADRVAEYRSKTDGNSMKTLALNEKKKFVYIGVAILALLLRFFR